MMDLLGADLPAAGGAAGQFAWADGPLLAALQAGAWVLLDELNLASAGPASETQKQDLLLARVQTRARVTAMPAQCAVAVLHESAAF